VGGLEPISTQFLGRVGVVSKGAPGRRGSARRPASCPGVGVTLGPAQRADKEARLAKRGVGIETWCNGCGLIVRMYVLSASVAVGSIAAHRRILATRLVGGSSRFVSHCSRVTVMLPSVT